MGNTGSGGGGGGGVRVEERYGYTMDGKDGVRGEGEVDVTRTQECILRLVVKQPHPNLPTLNPTKLYILKDYSVTHICIIERKIEEALLINQLQSLYKILLGQSATHLAYGVTQPTLRELVPYARFLISNRWRQEDEESGMDQFKLRIDFNGVDNRGFQKQFTELLWNFRSLSNNHRFQFRNFAHDNQKCVTLDTYSTRGVMDAFIQFCRGQVKEIYYE